ncbi:hypothetical protein [Daejeonella oryzae]|uniref:hypothetical protein n=1 Tax=Daejeonella oryzae TaxID=1122943 RepID=UPI0012DF90D0|nr:hypothetical protein [Daejeonella oryzae]
MIRQRKSDGESFVCLEVAGGVEIVQSQITGKMYATIRHCSIPCTFDEATAKQIVGSELPGIIVKQETDPYEYVNKKTGEVMMLNYSYSYQASPQSELIGSSKDFQSA